MKAPVVKIGKHKAVVLSDELLEQYGITDAVYLSLRDDHIIVKPKRRVRHGWKEAFKSAKEKSNLLIPEVLGTKNSNLGTKSIS